MSRLDVETEVHHVAFGDHVLLAFQTQPAGLLSTLLAIPGHIVVVTDNLGADESLLKIRVDFTRRFRRRCANFCRPGAHFLRARGEISLQT